ncbi:hypothetical protein EG68_04245 [Paragonimus skrjabini miyazakii]|uniref:Gamma-soluble NSF attachment protein n=1 Tax=Paragonimus skrjabini miyazakii TaxID=59628 RepID=A0A8S9YRT6_9TREM|nr:hypothetical protein EG68_04245 [Paragonimus skrjabini miyazakii]
MASLPEEVAELTCKAENLKTSFLKRTPDYDSAVEYYTKAALLCRNAKRLDASVELYQKVAELHFKLGSYFYCAKNYETAALIYKDLQQYEQMADLITKAGDLLRKAGSPDSAGYVYERAAKALEKSLPIRAAEFYESAADACQVEDKYHEASDHFNSAARVWVRLHRFEKAEKALRSYVDCVQLGNPDSTAATIGGLSDSSAVPKLCARAVVVLVLIKLYLGDEVAAEKVYSEAVAKWCFLETDENCSVKQLIFAYEERDPEAFAVAIKASCFRLLDLDYVRLMKEIKVVPSRESKPKKLQSEVHSDASPSSFENRSPSKNDSAQVSSASVPTGETFEDEEDDIKEDIC